MRIAFIMSRRDPSLPTVDNDGGVVLLLGYGKSLVTLGHTVDIYTSRANTGWGIDKYVSHKRSLQAEDSVQLIPGLTVIRKEVSPIHINDIVDLNSDSHVIQSSNIFADTFDDELKNYDIVNFFHPTSAYGLLSQGKVLPNQTILFPMLLSTEYAKFKNITQKYIDMEMSVLNSVGSIYSSSPFEMEELALLGVDMSKVSILARGFDTTTFKFKQRSSANNSNKLQIISIGAIRPQKQQDILVDVTIELAKRGIDAQINIVGDNINFSYEKNRIYYNQIEDRISNLNLQKNICFVGGKTPQELYGLIDTADIALFPSMAESFGKAALEAIACGLPVIASKNVEAYKIFMKHRLNSLMVESSVIDYVNAIEDLLSNKTLYRSLSVAGSTMSEQFSWESVTRQLEALYSKQATHQMINRGKVYEYTQ